MKRADTKENTVITTIEGNKQDTSRFLQEINNSSTMFATIQSNGYGENNQSWKKLKVEFVDKKEITNDFDVSLIEILDVDATDAYVEVDFRGKKSSSRHIEFKYYFRYDEITFYIDEQTHFMTNQTRTHLEQLMNKKTFQKNIRSLIVKELEKKKKYADIVQKIR